MPFSPPSRYKNKINAYLPCLFFRDRYPIHTFFFLYKIHVHVPRSWSGKENNIRTHPSQNVRILCTSFICLFPACFCGYSLMFSYIQRSLQNNILSNIEELEMLKKNNTIMCDKYIRLYYNSFHSAAFITNILYRDQGFLKLNSPVHLWQIRS